MLIYQLDDVDSWIYYRGSLGIDVGPHALECDEEFFEGWDCLPGYLVRFVEIPPIQPVGRSWNSRSRLESRVMKDHSCGVAGGAKSVSM